MARSKAREAGTEPAAGTKGKGKGKCGGAARGGEEARRPAVEGRLLGGVTNLVAVLFGLSLAAQEVVARVG